MQFFDLVSDLIVMVVLGRGDLSESWTLNVLTKVGVGELGTPLLGPKTWGCDAILVRSRGSLDRGDIALGQNDGLLFIANRGVNLDELTMWQAQDLTTLTPMQQQVAITTL